jgi:hypothetical protein
MMLAQNKVTVSNWSDINTVLSINYYYKTSTNWAGPIQSGGHHHHHIEM